MREGWTRPIRFDDPHCFRISGSIGHGIRFQCLFWFFSCHWVWTSTLDLCERNAGRSKPSCVTTHHFQNCNLCSKLTPWLWPDISQSILHPPSAKIGKSEIGARAHLRSAARGHLTTPRTRTRCFGPRSFRVSGLAVPDDNTNPELTLEHFKIENSSISSGICLAALTAPKWLG